MKSMVNFDYDQDDIVRGRLQMKVPYPNQGPTPNADPERLYIVAGGPWNEIEGGERFGENNDFICDCVMDKVTVCYEIMMLLVCMDRDPRDECHG